MRFTITVATILALLFLLGCQRDTQRLTQFDVHGIDVSHYQSRIDWEQLAGQPIHFAFLKATEGQTYQDSLFQHNWTEAKRTGILRGAYHFFRPDLPALDQALNFINTVQISLGDLPPVLDIELNPKEVGDIVVINRLRSWLQIIEKHYQIRPIIYTNLKYFNRYIDNNFEDYPIWIARYGGAAPQLDLNGQPWLFWQYGDRGRINGIAGHVDLNVFNGNLDALHNLRLGAGSAMSYVPVAE